MDKDSLYRYLGGNGFKRVSAVADDGTVSHEWERMCTECANLAYFSTDPNNYSPEAIQPIFDAASQVVSKCGHVVTIPNGV